jgi:pyrroline-5-carboxylate reductase
MNKEITIIGAGNMGQAVARGLIEQKVIHASSLTLANPRLTKLSELRNLGVDLESDNSTAVKGTETLILAVKPQIITSVLNQIRNVITEDQLVISLAAGISLNTLRQKLLDQQAVVRVMPNLGAQIGQSMSVWIKNEFVSSHQVQKVRAILNAIGNEVKVETEDEIDKATAISGSGPAYVFYLMEMLEDSARKLGFSDDVARKLSKQTLVGSAQIVENSDKSAKELREQVTSKGGTTEAAFKEFQRRGLKAIFMRGVNTAYRRAVDLGKS